MKRILLVLVSLLCLGTLQISSTVQIPPFTSYKPVYPVSHRNLSKIFFKNGKYKFNVDCLSSTGRQSTYKLVVEIVNDVVTTIYFPNGGYLHNGQNNSGYSYRGGGIEYQLSYDNSRIVGADVMIQVDYDDDSYQYFTIDMMQ